jgi:hypothetical protein
MADNGVGDTLDIVLVDLLGLDGRLPGLSVADSPLVALLGSGLGGEVGAYTCQTRRCHLRSRDYLPVRERWCLGRLSRRGVVPGTPIWLTSTLWFGPMPAETEERRDRVGWCSEGSSSQARSLGLLSADERGRAEVGAGE